MLVLYDRDTSSNALKVRFLLAELGLDYEKRHVPPERPRPDWLTSWHPVGGVPAIDDDGFMLAESNAILRYLASRERRADLYPDGDLRARARVDWVMDTWSTWVRPIFGPVEVAGGIRGPLDEAELAALMPATETMLGEIERLIADNGTAVGTFTIADMCAAPTLLRWRRLPFDHARWPKLDRLAETVLAHPSFLAAGPVR